LVYIPLTRRFTKMFVILPLLLCALSILPRINGFVPIRFGRPVRPLRKEINKPVEYRLPQEAVDVIRKINGFYGLVGPDVNITEAKTLYELFTGNGYIQGVFLEKGSVQYVRHVIRTDKMVYEENCGKLPTNVEAIPMLEWMDKRDVLPSPMNLANTAMMYMNRSLYALFERDVPILMDLDFANKTVRTVGRTKMEGIAHFSAHSVYRHESKTVETIDYDVCSSEVKYAVLNESMEIINHTTIKTNYLPIIHDFVSHEDTVVFTDSPLIAWPKYLFQGKVPVIFNPFLPTRFYVMNKHDFSYRIFETDKSMYIFHYADMIETPSTIIIYASVYRNLNLSGLDLQGCYSRITIDKLSEKVSIETSNHFKYANLDFPIKWGDKVILRNVNRRGATQFVVCRGLELVSIIDFKDRFICGEPVLVNVEGGDYLLCFLYDSEFNGYFTIVDLANFEKQITIPLDTKVGIGFHSIFVPYDRNDTIVQCKIMT